MAIAGRAAIKAKGERKSPKDRAGGALARLREARVRPETLLLTVIIVHARIAESYCDRSTEFRHTQIAKLAHRLAPRWHPPYADRVIPGSALAQDLKRYPHSAGQVLRHLGKALDDKAGIVSDIALKDVLTAKIGRFGPFAPTEQAPLPPREAVPSRFHRELAEAWRKALLPNRRRQG